MDYKNGKIYQILNNVNDEVYVGSTTQPLCKRLYKHKRNSIERLECKSPLYELMREFGKDIVYIELIELYPCNCKEELTAREGRYIRERGTLNKHIPGRTDKQYIEDNKERIKEYQKQWRGEHKEQIKQYIQQYYENNPDKKEQRKQNKQQYYENNPEKKEEKKHRMKQYREEHKEELAEKLKIKLICECGRELRKSDLKRHLKTNIHKELMEQQTQ